MIIGIWILWFLIAVLGFTLVGYKIGQASGEEGAAGFVALVGGIIGTSLFACTAISFGSVSGLYIKELWFSDVGYDSVFWTRVHAKWLLAAAYAIGALIIGWVILLRSVHTIPKGIRKLDQWKEMKPFFWTAGIVGIIAFAILMANVGASNWDEVLKFTHQENFGVEEPFFGVDYAFFVFELPIYQMISSFVWILFLAHAATLTLDWFTRSNLDMVSDELSDLYDARLIMRVIGSIGLLLFAWGVSLTLNPWEWAMRDGDLISGLSATDFDLRIFINSISRNTLLVLGMSLGGYSFFSRFNVLSTTWHLISVVIGVIIGVVGLTVMLIILPVEASLLSLVLTLVVVVIFGWALFNLTTYLAGVSAYESRKRKTKPGIRGLVLSSIVAGLLILSWWFGPPIYQSVRVNSSEQTFEEQYIKRQIAGTYYGYGFAEDVDFDGVLNSTNLTVETPHFRSTKTLTPSEYASDLNRSTLESARINDWRIVDQLNKTQYQGAKFFDFPDGDIMLYRQEDGSYKIFIVAARELDRNALSSNARNWEQEFLRYTHGYGLTAHTINTQNPISSLPEAILRNPSQLLQGDVPEEFQTEHYEIYFGEADHNLTIVNTKLDEINGFTQEELDRLFPDWEPEDFEYTGNAGIELGGFINRIFWALNQGKSRFITSANLQDDSRILLYTNIEDRVREIMPDDFVIGYDPYLMPGGEELYFVLDLISHAEIPYSQRLDNDEVYSESAESIFGDDAKNSNYFRPSVKAVVGAYTGDVTFYVVDPTDPITQVWSNIYPDLFRPMSEMPETLQANMRYPEDMVLAQRQILLRYHMTEYDEWYSLNKQWAIPREKKSLSETTESEPRYILMNVDGNSVEPVLTTPFRIADSSNEKQQLTGLAIVRMLPEHYGEMILYSMSESENVPGPLIVDDLITTYRGLSQQLSLLNSSGGGTEVIMANQLILPVRGNNGDMSFVYVKPIYQKSDRNFQTNVPKLEYVVLATPNRQVIVGPTLQVALENLYQDGARSVIDESLPDVTETETTEEPSVTVDPELEASLSSAELDQLRAAEACLQGPDGPDWICFGNQMDALEQLLLQNAQQSATE